MKPTILAIIIFLFGSIAFAQKIRFTDTTNIWGTFWYAKYPQQGYANYSWGKDTMVNGNTYRYISYWWVREDTTAGRVYVLRDDSTEQVLYDYNLKKGDTLDCKVFYINTIQYFKHVVKKVDSTLIQGVYHKIWQLDPVTLAGEPQSKSYVVIEGIGCTQRPTFAAYPYWNLWSSENIICFNTQGNKVTVKWPAGWVTTGKDTLISPMTCTLGIEALNPDGNITIAPNPCNGTFTIDLDNTTFKNASVIVYDMIGQTIYQSRITNSKFQIDLHQPAGIYVVKLQLDDAIITKRIIIE